MSILFLTVCNCNLAKIERSADNKKAPSALEKVQIFYYKILPSKSGKGQDTFVYDVRRFDFNFDIKSDVAVGVDNAKFFKLAFSDEFNHREANFPAVYAHSFEEAARSFIVVAVVFSLSYTK